ncbi:hypothetical protein FACS1894102_3170 [Spirochaetia bacterium]|nr:hypothetical protein FACS1894102_3170 [Spirochaetia bacterium]
MKKHLDRVIIILVMAMIACTLLIACGGGDGGSAPAPDEGDGIPNDYALSSSQPVSPVELKTRFVIKKTGKQGVLDTFYALHGLISAPKNNDDFSKIVRLGDWIDLPSLSVLGDAGAAEINITNAPVNSGNSVLLRLVVIGINSFKDINDNGNTKHVVFQFENIPVFRRMQLHYTDNYNIPANNIAGYSKSEIRSYLTNRFLTGLTNAGVPSRILWAPERVVENVHFSDDPWTQANGTAVLQTIVDKIWLPSGFEMGISGYGGEKAENQASFYGNDATKYYNDTNRKKYTTAGANSYWLASSYYQNQELIDYLTINADGDPDIPIVTNVAVNDIGIAPAFCIR